MLTHSRTTQRVDRGISVCVLPLDDAVVVQLSLGGQHDGVLLPGDVEQSGASELLDHMTHDSG